MRRHSAQILSTEDGICQKKIRLAKLKCISRPEWPRHDSICLMTMWWPASEAADQNEVEFFPPSSISSLSTTQHMQRQSTNSSWVHRQHSFQSRRFHRATVAMVTPKYSYRCHISWIPWVTHSGLTIAPHLNFAACTYTPTWPRVSERVEFNGPPDTIYMYVISEASL